MRRRQFLQMGVIVVALFTAPSTASAGWKIDSPTTGQLFAPTSPIPTTGTGTPLGVATILLKKGGIVQDSKSVTCDILGRWQHDFAAPPFGWDTGDWQAELTSGGESKDLVPYKVKELAPEDPPGPP